MIIVPNHYRVETNRASLSAYDVFIDYPVDLRVDAIHLSGRPGLGFDLDRDYLAGHALDGYGG